MNAKARITLLLSLVLGFANAAHAASDKEPVWVENESFGLEACSSAAHASSEQVAATVSKLRARAMSDLAALLRVSGVQLSTNQFITLTPVDGALTCGGIDSRITYHVAAIDQAAGQLWSSDMTVSGSLDRVKLNHMAGDLARRFNVAIAKASPR